MMSYWHRTMRIYQIKSKLKTLNIFVLTKDMPSILECLHEIKYC